MSGFFSPAAAKMSMTSSAAIARETIWRIGVVQLLAPAVARRRRAFASAGPHRLEEADIVADRQRLVVRHGQGERLATAR